jgi:hypothetical protein
MNSAVNVSTGYSPHQLLYGIRLRQPMDMIKQAFDTEQDANKPERQPLTGQVQDPEPPVQIAGEDEWEVDCILDSRLYYRKLQYKIQWKSYDVDNAW